LRNEKVKKSGLVQGPMGRAKSKKKSWELVGWELVGWELVG
jgi:hypothetical protein